jgi:hypothetical protein
MRACRRYRAGTSNPDLQIDISAQLDHLPEPRCGPGRQHRLKAASMGIIMRSTEGDSAALPTALSAKTSCDARTSGR